MFKFVLAIKVRTVGDKSQNSCATESTLNFSGLRDIIMSNYSLR